MISQKLLYTQPISSQNFSLRNMISKSRLKKYFNFVQFFIVDILIKQSFNNSHLQLKRKKSEEQYYYYLNLLFLVMFVLKRKLTL